METNKKLDKVFDSENISYVRVSKYLVDDYLCMINDWENVGRFIGKNEPTSKEEEILWARRKLADQDFFLSMIEKSSGRFIGTIGIEDICNGRGELGIAITADMQNRGYGKEAIRTVCGIAFKELDLNVIYLKAFPFNERALHVYRECGFEEYDCNEDDIFLEIRKDEFFLSDKEHS